MPQLRHLTWMMMAAFGLLLSASPSDAQQQDPGDQPGLVADDSYAADPEWQDYLKQSPDIVVKMKSRILVPAPFSPIR